MDDLTSKLSEILGDPNTMEQIKGLAGMFGQTQKNTDIEKEEKEDDIPTGMPNLFGQGEILQMAMKLMPLISAYKRDDETTRLLQALRPFLSDVRRKKLDEAMKLLQILRILPMLKNSFLN